MLNFGNNPEKLIFTGVQVKNVKSSMHFGFYYFSIHKVHCNHFKPRLKSLSRSEAEIQILFNPIQ